MRIVCREDDYPEAPESEMLEKVVNIVADNKDEEILRLRKALEEIREFGRVNAGCGYTCAKMAQKALEFENDNEN